MALARRASSRGAESYIWPGFVDALATLLMVIIFVLMVFFLIQINLAQRVSGQDATLERLRGEISSLATLLNMAQDDNAALKLDNAQLTSALSDSARRIASLDDQIAVLEDTLRLANADKADLEDVLKAVTTRAELAESERDSAHDEIDQQKLMLAALELRLEEMTRARDDEAASRLAAEDQTRASKQEVFILTQSVLGLKDKLSQLQALLDEKEEEARIAKEASLNLTRQLNNALTSKVLELQRFRSEFFGRLREVLKDRSDVKIVGDRFVFQSEVLFDPGSADIGGEGERQLNALTTALLEISGSIPTDIDWVLQVTGHTDDIPISTPRFRDNSDLSTERAFSVVRYFVLAGIDPDRLSAAGFGEFHPIDTNDTPEARARNRRIEVKLTRR
ncbi:MAG: OmpA family protein [Alphaproteobacteria bacterium]|nr:OmpA family protein [Alphaproteobacteria bacterium]